MARLAPLTDALANGVAPRPLQPEDAEVSAGAPPAASNVRIISMSMTRWPCGSCAGEGKAIMTISEAARLLGVSKKRMEGIIYQEKGRLGRLPDFVGDAGGKIQRRVLADELMEWVKSRRIKRGRPSKSQARD
jgi:hypothetical protein